MAECRVNPEQKKALARLKCAHCQSLVNCEALAEAVLTELRRRFRVDCRRGDDESKATDPELIAAVRAGIDRFLSESLDDAA
jgi:hypothetical protein